MSGMWGWVFGSAVVVVIFILAFTVSPTQLLGFREFVDQVRSGGSVTLPATVVTGTICLLLGIFIGRRT